ncbi:hypothetical protein PLCT1_02399 [Planctomycetaceae bacterium]|nr:hypothetical protein PLCT1_02399 [Planctomycetaceae bacterium]
MPFHYKAFLLVMAITAVMFHLARPMFTRFMSHEDFAVRRNLWLALTVAAFLIPNYWVYTGVAILMVAFAGSKDSNPAALYMFLLLALPPLREAIPGFGLIKQVFPIDHLRLLSLVLLLPVALQLVGPTDRYGTGAWPDGSRRARLQPPDFFLLLYAALQVALLFPHESVTASLRRMLLLCLDMLLPYFVVSRLCRSRAAIVETMASFALAMVVLAPLAWIEFARGWILYAGLEERWGTRHMIGYLMRGEFLRAQVTGGHAIVLGYAMAVGFGFWLYLMTRVDSMKWRGLAMLTIVGGLVATLARGPWVGTAAMLLTYLALGPQAATRSAKALGGLAVVGGILMLTPFGANIVDHLPFIGTVSDNTVTYRQRLAELSWELVLQNPLLGSPYYMAYMEELRQGEGIIDVVNTYAGIALSYGLVGMSMFAGFFIATLVRVLRVVRNRSDSDADYSLLGASLVTCTVGVLIIIATTSNYLSIPYVYFVLGALGFAYVQVSRTEQPWQPVPLTQPNWATQPGGAASAGGMTRLLREGAARRAPR